MQNILFQINPWFSNVYCYNVFHFGQPNTVEEQNVPVPIVPKCIDLQKSNSHGRAWR